MNTPLPDDEKNAALHAALQRDAARVQPPPFDPALHHATMRRVRAMEESSAPRWNWSWKPALAGAAALAMIALCIGLPRGTQDTARKAAPAPDFTAVLASTQKATARLVADTSSPLPAWMSPTASLLDFPRLQSNQQKQQL